MLVCALLFSTVTLRVCVLQRLVIHHLFLLQTELAGRNYADAESDFDGPIRSRTLKQQVGTRGNVDGQVLLVNVSIMSNVP